MYRDDPPAPEAALESFDSTEPTEYMAPLFDDEDRTSIVHLPWFMVQDEWTRFPVLDGIEDGDDPTAVERPKARVSQMLAERQSRAWSEREPRARHDTVPSPTVPPRQRREEPGRAPGAPQRVEEPELRKRRDTLSTASFHDMQTAPAGPQNVRVKEAWEQYDGPDLFDLLANYDSPRDDSAPAAATAPPVDPGAEASDFIDELIAREAAAIRQRPEDTTFLVTDDLEPRKPSRRGLGLLAALLVLAGLGLAILYFHARQIWEPSLSKRAPDTVLPLADDVEQSPAPASFLSSLEGAL